MFDDSSPTDTAFLYELARDARESAVVAYLRRGSSAVVRRRAAEMLGDFATDTSDETAEEIVRALVEAVREDDDDGVRARAIDALSRYGEDAIERLVRELDGIDADAPADRPTPELLEEWLDADRPEFRMVAATALGRIGRPRSLSALLPATRDPSPRVRTRAVRACGRIGHERCTRPLEARLDDPQRTVREAAVRALGSIGPRAALRPLVLVRALTDDTESVQRAAMLSLVQLFAEAPPEQRGRVRDAIAEQLSRADTQSMVPHAVDMLDEGRRTTVRQTAAWLLGHLADADAEADGDDHHLESAYDCLIDALGSEDDRTARLAAASLAELGSDELERRLRILIHDEDVSEPVTDRAEWVLEEIGGSLSTEVVTNAVDYTYVLEPADYTNRQRADDSPDDPES